MRNSTLPAVSEKRRAANVRYERAKREARAKHDGQCQMMLYESDKPATFLAYLGTGAGGIHRCPRRCMTTPHHQKGNSGELLWDSRFFLWLCFDHHHWVDTHRKQATALGYFIREYQKH